MGRDIIASKIGTDGVEIIYIIQCKNWASKKEIHENIICQLYGTTIKYKLDNKKLFSRVIPVICTTVHLTETANEFAKALGVEVWVIKKGDYPMIKCNINNGNKIYHLPFDQKYNQTQICKDGEFYAWTVKEAVEQGFRRAFKYNITTVH